jgi:DNA-directed RNA polymerase II subunit RPB2
MDIDEKHFKIIDTFFRENTLVDHHLNSCNNFYEKDIFKVLKDMNPIQYYSEFDEKLKTHKYNTNIYIGGVNADKVYYGKPCIFDSDNHHYMIPNEARLRNMTYGITIHFDVDIELTILENGQEKKVMKTLPEVEGEHFFLGMFPIMLQSNLCILKNMPKETRYTMGECNHDYGGYFIIDGKEKVIVPQEKFSNNMIYIRTVKDDLHDFSVEVRSVSEDASKPQRTFAIRRIMDKPNAINGQIMVFIPNVRKSIPLFIVMRALGIISDKDICKMIVQDIDVYKHYIKTLIPCVHDAGGIFTQMNAIEYIASFTKVKTIQEGYNILINYLLPHVGEMNFKSKAYYIGHMIFELLKVIHNDEKVTDRDNFKYKRVDSTGYLMKELFIEHATMMYESIYKNIDKEFYYHSADFIDKDVLENPKNTMYLQLFKEEHFNERIIEKGFLKGFKGNWGAQSHTKRDGVLQSLNRLSYLSFINHLRKVNLALDSSSKLVTPHALNGSHWGLIDPVDTPDGKNIGLDKHMAVMCKFTDHISLYDINRWIMDNFFKDIIILEACLHEDIHKNSKLFINGVWIGVVIQPIIFVKKLISARRLGLIPSTISVSYNFKSNVIYIYGDEGRLIRPILFYEEGRISYEGREDVIDGFWENYLKGWLDLKDDFNPISLIKDMDEKTLQLKQSILDYLDCAEAESSYISIYHEEQYKKHTHLEIHPSLMLGIMGNQICYPQHNPCPRNVFSCSQTKAALSLYHSNYLNRIDKMGVMLNYGQKPLARTRYLNYLNEDKHPYGINAIVAIMCHSGYNVEDYILFNESSIKRGLFKTTYYSMYETYEETSNDKSSSEKRIKNIYDEPLIKNTKPGYNYNELDKNGIIKENTLMDEKNVLIGKIMFSKETPDDITDESIFPKKGQLGYVDKTYITENEEGRRIAKVRIREDRDPATGDKFASRCGQKGTIGNIISAENMPFTKDGIQPDLIINPHALPSRMTIGQFLESVFNKVACEKGCSIDNTAFLNKGSKYNETGALLNSYGYHSSGNELLYNGMTGEQIESEIFIGPTYYMRLKHMVKDKINYRAGGPRTLLTRQTNQGRANDGGLRIGEMERDGVIAHGMATFLYDAMMKRGDEYKVVICNHSGTIAIYNKEVNNFYSPIVDGPIQYDMDINNITPNIITKYGKEFSVVKIPYCFKLLIQELGAMNVQMRLITADNIDQLTVTGNTNLSEIIKSEVPTTLLSKRNVNQNVNIEKLSQLEEQYNTSMTNYNSRLKVLKQKFNKLTGKKPVNSYYKKELNDLRNKYLTNKETYYDLSKEIYKDEIDEIIEKLDELKVNYNSSLKLNKPIEIEKIKLEYNKYLKLFKKYTGEDYNVLLEDFKNISLAEPQLEPVIEQPKQSQPPVKKELATGPLVVKKMGNEASTAESSTTETSSAESNESNNGTSGNNESLSQESNESK